MHLTLMNSFQELAVRRYRKIERLLLLNTLLGVGGVGQIFVTFTLYLRSQRHFEMSKINLYRCTLLDVGKELKRFC